MGPGEESLSRSPIAWRRLVILAPAGLSLLAGLTGALALVGALAGGPGSGLRLAAGHGVLMGLGFLGTLIALERAVALGRSWGYAAPLATGLGGLVAAGYAIVGLPAIAAPAAATLSAASFTVGAIATVAMYAAFDRIERSLHGTVMALGALAWLVATLILLAGRSPAEAVPWLAAMLVLTIVGERLELSRLVRKPPVALVVFGGSVVALGAGVGLSLVELDLGGRLVGAAFLALAAWLARYDIATRTIRSNGVTRFIASALLAGFTWLAVAGALWLAGGAVAPGPLRDAALHALFLGFVMSMVFGHAPIILPAVVRLPLPYRPRFYAHLALLHAGLALRVGGDLAGLPDAAWIGGLLGVVAVLVFLGSSAAAAAGGRRAVA